MIEFLSQKYFGLPLFALLAAFATIGSFLINAINFVRALRNESDKNQVPRDQIAPPEQPNVTIERPPVVIRAKIHDSTQKLVRQLLLVFMLHSIYVYIIYDAATSKKAQSLPYILLVIAFPILFASLYWVAPLLRALVGRKFYKTYPTHTKSRPSKGASCSPRKRERSSKSKGKK